VRLRLRPADARFGDLLAALAGNVVASAGMLSRLLGADREDRDRAAADLLVVDLEAENGVHAVLRALSASFVTPFAREDVYRVAWAMRQCTARIHAAAQEIVLFDLGEFPRGTADLVQHVSRAADVTAEAVPRLARPRTLADPWIELTRLGKQAGQAHRLLLAEITAGTADPAALARLTAVAQSLRRVAEAFEDVADALQLVAVKEG
jgi:uncharacterized protein Yka (UPF0111/DUF47 family)